MLFRIQILLRAHAVVGVLPTGEVAEPAQPAHDDCTEYRICHYDVAFKIQCRIERCLRDVPPDMQEGWLLRMFDAEQRYWIETMRENNNKNMTIGQVMLQPLVHREAIWSQPVVPSPVKERPPARDAEAPTRGRRGSQERQIEFDPKNFCSAYNRGKCPWGDKCRYTHRCGRKTEDRSDGTAHYCNGRHPEKKHDKVMGKGKVSASASAKVKLKCRANTWNRKGGGGKR